ncbi:hypothetical protein RHMOL_Rhmol13G0167000 [Rhododendron molle]|uniref:Uncharacterized protein n=1 Tax=Rhododendron molle TaxID=49168 RepID=A0ACC0L7J1_RHOML|nr:hypothetical protein RHMOL_Rhmol13G0167000 [Rhododendron molle]
MDAGNGDDRQSHSGSSDELPRNPIAPQGRGSVGEEAASNTVGGGSGAGPLGSTATPTDSNRAASNSGLSGSIFLFIYLVHLAFIYLFSAATAAGSCFVGHCRCQGPNHVKA